MAGPLPRLRRLGLVRRGSGRGGAQGARPRQEGGDGAGGGTASGPVRLSEVVSSATERFSSGIDELDRVLGGGIVPGSLVLVGGEPGIGKSTLLLQVLDNVAAGRPALLVCGEESAAQVKMRAERICRGAGNIDVLAETELETRPRGRRRRAPGAGRRRLRADALQRRLHVGAGQREPGARSGGPLPPPGQGHRRRRLPRRPRHQGGRHRRPAGPGAHGRHGAPVRGRPLPLLPHAARRQEPLRLHQRAGDLRDDRVGPADGARPVRALPQRRSAGGGLRRARRRRGHALLPGRGAGAREPDGAGDAASRRRRVRPQPARHARGRARAPCPAAVVYFGHFCYNCRRNSHRRARGGPRGRTRYRLCATRHGFPPGRRCSGRSA